MNIFKYYIHTYIKMIQMYCEKCYQNFHVKLNNQVIHFFFLPPVPFKNFLKGNYLQR